MSNLIFFSPSSKLTSSLFELIKSTTRFLAFCRHSLNVTFYLQAAILRIGDVQAKNTYYLEIEYYTVRLIRKLFSLCSFYLLNFLLWKIINMYISIWSTIRNPCPIQLTQLQQLPHDQSCFICTPTQTSPSPYQFRANIRNHII